MNAPTGAGAPVEQSCREGFGMPVSAMENELRGYVQQLAFPSQVVTFAEPIASRASAPGRALADPAVDARLGDFLVVKAGDRVLRPSVPQMDTMDFISYRDDLRGDVSCGARKPPDPVYVTWKPAPPGPAGSPAGEAVAVEFVPKDFVPKTVK